MIVITEKDLFHVHTYRCGHAEEVEDEAYIKRAIELNTRSIWFSDHAPFPGNPFGSRMGIEQLEEYLTTLCVLKERYKGVIDVHTGLETEYFPSFDKEGYYKKLKADERMDFLLLGQHMAETGDKEYSFSWDKERLKKEEYLVLGNAVIDGIKSGYFDAVAHPDRVFRRLKGWTPEAEEMANRIVKAAKEHNIPLEMNLYSMRQKNLYRPEFWELAEGCDRIIGLDAHSVEELNQCRR